MNDGELRQAMSVLEAYNRQLETLNRQTQVLQASLDDLLRARDTLKAVKEGKEGDELLLPIGAATYINVRLTGETKVVLGIGAKVLVEKEIDDAVDYISEAGNDCSEALKSTLTALQEIEANTQQLSAAVQEEYRQRQAAMGR